MRQIEFLRISDIAVLDGRRHLDQEDVESLANSISSIGLRVPITVRFVDGYNDGGRVIDGQPVLVTGHHRLKAVESLGWDSIECFIFDSDDELDAHRWEIAENLHRADLSAADRAEQVALWIQLTEQKQDRDRQPVQVGPAANLSDGRKAGPQHQESGTNAAARELGVSATQAKRAKKIASMTPEAKQAAVDAGLDDNQKAERKKQTDEQKAKAKRRKELDDLMSAWERARIEVRNEFVAWMKGHTNG